MAQHKLKIEFTERVSREDRELFTGFFETYGTVYTTHRENEIVVLANPSSEKILKDQLNAWAQEGALSWSNAI